MTWEGNLVSLVITCAIM